MTTNEIREELRSVRVRMSRLHENDRDMLWGAQQALLWVLGEGKPMSTIQDVVTQVALEITHDHSRA